MDSGYLSLQDEEVYDYTISAVRDVTEVLRSTLGPMGLDKLLVDENGTVVITNDGVTILQEMAIDDPMGKIVRRVAEQQVARCGDGTTTAALLSGELLKQADELLSMGTHPLTIVQGFNVANELVRAELDHFSTPVDVTDDSILAKIAETSGRGKGSHVVSRARIADVALEAVQSVTTAENVVDLDAIKVEKEAGGAASELGVYRGALVKEDDQERIGQAIEDLSRSIPDASVVLLAGPLGRAESDSEVGASVGDAEQLAVFQQHEADAAAAKASHLADLGVDVVFYAEGKDDEVLRQLTNRGVLPIRASRPKLRFLREVLDGQLVPSVEQVTGDAVVRADVRHDPEREWFHVDGDGEVGVTVSIRGVNKQLVDEIHRSVTDATDAVGHVVDDGRVLSGGGATETELARRLRIYAKDVPDRKQLAVERFADALETIPRSLAHNAGLDGLDVLIALRNRHADGELHAGIDVYSKEIADMEELGVLEPRSQKATAISLATQAAVTVLRVDGVIEIDRGFVYKDEDEEEAESPLAE